MTHDGETPGEKTARLQREREIAMDGWWRAVVARAPQIGENESVICSANIFTDAFCKKFGVDL